jgi:hypothetical protein
VRIRNSFVPMDLVVLEMDVCRQIPLILGRSFLSTTGATIDVATSRDQGIMIKLIIDYLWHDAHACFMISESLIKLLGPNQRRDGWNTWITNLIRKIIKDSSTTR